MRRSTPPSRRAGAGSALLPDRPADETDEDTLGIAELGRRLWRSATPITLGDRHRPRSGASCPSRRPRSSGSAGHHRRVRRKINLLRDATRGCAGSHCAGTSPSDRRRGHRQPGDRRTGAVIERVWRAGGTFQEWSEHFDLVCGPTPSPPRVSASTRPSTETETSTRHSAWDHISAGCTGLPLDRLAGRTGRGGCRGLPLDALL